MIVAWKLFLGILVLLVVLAAAAFLVILGMLLSGKWSLENRKLSLHPQQLLSFQKDFTDQEITGLELSNQTADIVLSAGEHFTVKGENLPETFSCEVADQTLRINNPSKCSNWFFKIRRNSGFSPKIEIRVPKGLDLEWVKLENGVGNLKVSDLTAKNFSVASGVGDFQGERLTASHADISGGTGHITLCDVDFSGLELIARVGDVDYQGTLTGVSSLDCSVGNVRMELVGSKEDYSFWVDSNIGKVSINGEPTKGTRLGGTNELRIQSGVGDVTVSFVAP